MKNLYEKTVLPLYYQIGECKAKIDSLIEDRESRVELIKSFEKPLYDWFAFDVKMSAKYPEVFKHSASADNMKYQLAVIDEQCQKIVEADREIERLYYKLSDTVKSAKAAEAEYYKLSA